MFELQLFLFLIVGSSLLTAFALGIGFFLQRKISFLHDPVYVPSSEEAIEIMIQLSGLHPDELLIDFGSGDGRVVITAAEKGALAIGYEIHPLLVHQSRKKIRQADLQERAVILSNSFWKADVGDADVVILYTTASIMERLEKKLRSELKPGARVISQQFRFPDWKIKKQIKNIHLYVQE